MEKVLRGVVGEQESLPTTATALNTRAGLEPGPRRAQAGPPPHLAKVAPSGAREDTGLEAGPREDVVKELNAVPDGKLIEVEAKEIVPGELA